MVGRMHNVQSVVYVYLAFSRFGLEFRLIRRLKWLFRFKTCRAIDLASFEIYKNQVFFEFLNNSIENAPHLQHDLIFFS